MMSYRLVSLGLTAMLGACGGDDGGGGADGGGGDDPCGFGSAAYLPYQDGFSWSYRVTDLGTGTRETKSQSLVSGSHPDLGEVLIQTTDKGNGATVSYLKKVGDRVERYIQEDRDSTGALEKTTTYDPAQIRIDESPERLEVGAEWDESYTATETDPNGVVLLETATVDTWKVLATDAECDSPFGTFQCVRLLRTRTQGGVAEKEFQYASGVGKVREIGSNQLEELMACGPE